MRHAIIKLDGVLGVTMSQRERAQSQNYWYRAIAHEEEETTDA